MKKIEAILKGCSFVDKLFSLREKEIRRNLDAAKDECKEAEINYQISYEEAMQKLGEKDVDYGKVLNDMITAKEGIINAQATLKVINEIEKDLNENVELTEEVKKHNHFAERLPVVEEQIKVINHRINDLEEICKGGRPA